MSNTTLSRKGWRLTHALRSGAFAWFWMGQTISLLGDGAFRVALAVAVYRLTGSSLAMGLLLTAQILPEVLLTLIGGVAADRLSRRLVLACSDVGRAVVVLLIAGLAWLSLLRLWHLLVLALLFGFIQSFFGPAYRAIVPELVIKEHYSSANALTELGVQLGGVLGPILGAGLIGLGSGTTSLAFAFDGLTFVMSVCSLLALRSLPVSEVGQRDQKERKPMSFHQMRQEMAEGFRTIWGSAWLRWSMIAATFGWVAYTGAVSVSLPKLVFAVYGSGAWLLAAMSTAVGCGALAGTIFVGQAHLRRRGVMAFLAYALSGLALTAFSLPITGALVPFVVVPAAFFVGVGMSVMQTIWLTLLYELVPHDKLGRVASVDLLGSLGLLQLGYVLAGWLGDHWGPSLVFLLAGITMVVLDLLPLFLRDIRALR